MKASLKLVPMIAAVAMMSHRANAYTTVDTKGRVHVTDDAPAILSGHANVDTKERVHEEGLLAVSVAPISTGATVIDTKGRTHDRVLPEHHGCSCC